MGLFDGGLGGAGTGMALGGPVGAGIGGAVGLIGGLLGADSERDKQEKEGKIRAAEIRASPWTHMTPQQQVNFAGGTAGKALAGVGSGLGLAQSLGNATQSAPTPWANMASQQQASALNAMPSFGGVGQFSPNDMMKNPTLFSS